MPGASYRATLPTSEAEWQDWAVRMLAAAEAAGADEILLDFGSRIPVEARLLAQVQFLAGRWNDPVRQRRLRLHGLQPALVQALALLGMAERKQVRPIDGWLDGAGVIHLRFLSGIEPTALSTPEAMSWLDGVQVDEVVVDCENLDNLTSSVIHWLLSLQARIPSVELDRPSSRVALILAQMRLDTIFPVRRPPLDVKKPTPVRLAKPQ